MNIVKLGRKILPLAIAAAVGSGATYVYCYLNNEATIAELEEQIAELQNTEREALVTKRISEQMEDIAYQQKEISDKQRERAEEQSRIADIERGKAEIERMAAREAEKKAIVSAHQAVLSAHQADSMRTVAEHHMLDAQQQKAHADTLLYKSIGISLAQSALQQEHAGNTSLAALMSYAGWDYTRLYKGNQYQQDVFAAIVETSNADKSLQGVVKGNIRDISILKGEKRSRAIVAISDYGEIVTVPTTTTTPWGTGIRIEPEVLFADSKYDFRHIMMTEDEHALVLDIKGNLIEVEFGEGAFCEATALPVPDDYWMKIAKTSDGRYVLVGKKHIAWLSYDRKSIVNTRLMERTITAAGQRDDGTLVLCSKEGAVIIVTDETHINIKDVPWMKETQATAYVYQSKLKYDIIGADNGTLYIYDTNGNYVRSLIGHKARIADIDQYSNMAISSSYDNTIRIWNLVHINDMIVSNEISFDRWPLSVMFDNTASTLQIGLADGDLHSLNISARSNAEAARKKIEREFTIDEWNYYIGKGVPFKKFMP